MYGLGVDLRSLVNGYWRLVSRLHRVEQPVMKFYTNSTHLYMSVPRATLSDMTLHMSTMNLHIRAT